MFGPPMFPDVSPATYMLPHWSAEMPLAPSPAAFPPIAFAIQSFERMQWPPRQGNHENRKAHTYMHSCYSESASLVSEPTELVRLAVRNVQKSVGFGGEAEEFWVLRLSAAIHAFALSSHLWASSALPCCDRIIASSTQSYAIDSPSAQT